MTHADPAAFDCRTPCGDDFAAARALIASAADDPYAVRALELLAMAATGTEYRALVATGRDTAIIGVGIYGLVAGASGAGAIYTVIGPTVDTMAILVQRMMAAFHSLGARFAVAELADDPALAPQRSALLTQGFIEEARVHDLYRDGVALAFLRRDLP